MSVNDIIATKQLFSRPSRPADFKAENDALASLIKVMGESPDKVLQHLADTAMALCQAESAGVSVEELDAGEEIFRWHATAGNYSRYLLGTMPRRFSPCGEVIDRNEPILMIDMVRYYPYVSDLNLPPYEVLLVPFHEKGIPIGTLWVVAHDGKRQFDGEDLRILQSLTKFASVAVQAFARTRELEAANAAARVHKAELMATDRRKDEFLATLAHELRNLLAPVTNALNVASHVQCRPEIRDKAYGTMGRQLGQTVRLVDDLLDFSRINEGKIELRTETVRLVDVIHSALETSQSLIDAGGHTLSVSIADEEIYLAGDFTRLTQIFANLVNNAAKYTPSAGTIHILVEVTGDEVLVTVKDNGIGIGMETLPHIFGMFNQIDSSAEHSQGGLGIGLALVRNLVTLHGGSVTAKSDGLGFGSEFVVSLPLAKQPPSSADPQVETLETDVQSLRVLVVDDNVASAQTMAWMLEMMGHQTQLVHEGREVLAAAADFGADAILLDIGLPGMNGYDVCRAIRADAKLANVYLIAQTGWAQNKDIQQAAEAGFDAHLVKPIPMDTLENALKLVKPVPN